MAKILTNNLFNQTLTAQAGSLACTCLHTNQYLRTANRFGYTTILTNAPIVQDECVIFYPNTKFKA